MLTEQYQIKLKQFGKKLKAMRKDKGLTQIKLAEISGMDIRQLQRIEAGEVDIRMSTFWRWVDAVADPLPIGDANQDCEGL